MAPRDQGGRDPRGLISPQLIEDSVDDSHYFGSGVSAVYHDAARLPLCRILSTPPLSILPPPPSSIPQRHAFGYCLPMPTHSDGLSHPGVERRMRGQQLIAEANNTNPYRIRREAQRARSRSPCAMPPRSGYQLPQHEVDLRTTGDVRSSHFLVPPHHASDIYNQPETPVRGRRRDRKPMVDGVPEIDSPLEATHDPNQDPVLQDLCRELHSPDHAPDSIYLPSNAANEDLDLPICEFAAPCRLNGSPDGYHFRKVVSHVFGRNKAVTKIFPQDVWVHYCRKHYQRARYRADQWPFTQCDLLLESLRRMQDWNGVGSWDLDLRRREKIRVGIVTGELNESTKQPVSKNEDSDNQVPVKSNRPGRKHPTAIVAPAPEWLRNAIGKRKTFDEIRSIIERVREYMSELRRREKENQAQSSLITPETDKDDLSSYNPPKRNPKAKAPKLRPTVSMVRFPDVEILPNFKPWVIEAALRQRSATAPSLEDDIKFQVPKQMIEMAHVGSKIKDAHRRSPQHPMIHSLGGLPYRPSPRIQNAFFPSTPQSGAVVVPSSRSLQGTIGRAGTNRGNSASQQRRSERVYQHALDRVSPRGAVKKPNKSDQK